MNGSSMQTPREIGSNRAAGASTRFPPAAAPSGHVVFLVPGLLGFESFASYAYFADRVTAAIRVRLETAVGESVPVITVPIPPTASLQSRQRRLVKTLANQVLALFPHGEVPQLHLVGHSTGGLDINQLTNDVPLGGGMWADIDPRAPRVVAAIRSVTTLASPHQGACIALDPAAEFVRSGSLRAVPSVLTLLAKFLLGAIDDPEVRDFALGASADRRSIFRFLREVLEHGELVGDLRPSREVGLGNFRRDVVRKSFVTIANTPRPGDLGPGRPDAFFRELSERASGWNTGSTEHGALIAASVERLREVQGSPGTIPIIANRAALLPSRLEAWHNDGVVNTARQLFDPSDPDELAGIVIADHFDVVGHYDRTVWTVDSAGNDIAIPMNSGLLNSGSAFRDVEFFELYARIADVIANAALSTSSARSTSGSPGVSDETARNVGVGERHWDSEENVALGAQLREASGVK